MQVVLGSNGRMKNDQNEIDAKECIKSEATLKKLIKHRGWVAQWDAHPSSGFVVHLLARVVLNHILSLRSGRGPTRGNPGICDFLALRQRGRTVGKVIRQKRDFVDELAYDEERKVVQIPTDDKDEPIREIRVRDPKADNVCKDNGASSKFSKYKSFMAASQQVVIECPNCSRPVRDRHKLGSPAPVHAEMHAQAVQREASYVPGRCAACVCFLSAALSFITFTLLL